MDWLFYELYVIESLTQVLRIAKGWNSNKQWAWIIYLRFFSAILRYTQEADQNDREWLG